MTIGAILIGLVPQTFMPYYFAASVSLVLISIFIYANTEIFKEMFNNKSNFIL